jgi:hypothetical protein
MNIHDIRKICNSAKNVDAKVRARRIFFLLQDVCQADISPKNRFEILVYYNQHFLI